MIFLKIQYSKEALFKKEMMQKKLVNFAVNKLGSLDILINCADQAKSTKSFDFEETWDWVMGINLKGTYLMSYYASNEMKENGVNSQFGFYKWICWIQSSELIQN